MHSAPLVATAHATAWQRWRRWLGRWWRHQTPARQDRFVTLAPLVSVLLFLAAIISAFWYLRNEEIERETETVKRDTEIAQQQVRLHLIENQEQLSRMAGELSQHEGDVEGFLTQAAAFVRERATVTQIAWLDNDGRRRAGQWAMPYRADNSGAAAAADPSLPHRGSNSPATLAFDRAREERQPVYSLPFADDTGTPVFQLQVPLVTHNSVSGTLMLEYSIEGLMRHYVPQEVSSRHSLEILDAASRTLASTVTPMPNAPASRRAAIVYDVPLAPAMNGLVLRGQGFRTSIGLISNTLFWMVVALSVLTVWMLLGSWRHLRRRAQIQAALVQETNFRRAMENSMLTGMRAMDLEGRISYVNAAFCAMTGFNEAALVGRPPPYPYWPHDRIEENTRLLQQELRGRSPAGGIEVRVMRQDGSLFDARMYVSPLVDPHGQQTGWMTSMTNITEAKRIRDQLSASHERFTTVLEGLDASVSVLSVPQGELLFANRSYRLWFGTDAGGHGLLTGGIPAAASLPDAEDISDGPGLPAERLVESGSDPREVYVAPLKKWFDVRARYLQWTDGRLAQMLIATDISARHRAEAQAAQQAERAQVTSRLVTMGEMASSVAHELNQPLTAITNYCNGMVSRVDSDSILKQDLLAALRKTARQAERAGETIRRIRAFVKKSEPVRQPAQARQIVEDAVELAGIELRRRNVAIHTYIAQRLPTLEVDPILIEQVLMNLLKNAAEAIDGAQLPAARRHIDLRVVPRHTAEEGGVIEFSVTDLGPGLQGEVIGRLYEAFFSTKAEGLGIGLSLCRSIVESHHGRIRAQNTYNGDSVSGCRFSFTLPVHVPTRSAGAAAAAAPQSVSNSSSVTS